jgi:hypothetical protein
MENSKINIEPLIPYNPNGLSNSDHQVSEPLFCFMFSMFSFNLF